MKLKKKIRQILGDDLFFKIIKLKRRLKFVSKRDIKKINSLSKDYPDVMTINETIDWIINNKGSISRYGDGEFGICLKKDISSFQSYSKNLRQKLIEILISGNNNNFLVCIPPFQTKYNDIKNYYGILSFWEYYWLKNFEEIKPFFKSKKYGNSFISRSDVFYESNAENIKRIWSNRKVVFVYGNNGRFEVESELFKNIKDYKEIKVSPQNAFLQYDLILKKCLEYDKDYLFLLAIGQTATVIAFDLYKQGYQVLDIGHLPNSYNQYLGKIVSPERIPIIKDKRDTTI